MLKTNEHKTLIHKVELGEIDKCEVMGVADLHYGDPAQDGVMIAEMKRWLKEDSNRFIVILGDIFNAAIKASVSDTYSESMNIDQSMEAFISQFEPIRDRILGVVDGNHDRRVWREVGVDPVKWCCHQLGVKYFGAEGYIALTLGNQKPNNYDRVRPFYYLLHLHHGIGGGRTEGANLNSLKALGAVCPPADVHFAGHTHKPVVLPEQVPYVDSQFRSIKLRGKLYVRTGSSLDREGYAITHAFPHVSKQWVTVTFHGRKRLMEAALHA